MEQSTRLFRDDVHPRLFFGPEDLPALRAKTQKGIGARILAEMVRRCERYTDPKSPDFVDPTADRETLMDGFGGGAWNCTSIAVHCLTFSYALTGEERWANACLALMHTLVKPGASDPNVCHSTLGNQLTLGFDVLHEVMSEAERGKFTGFLRNDVVAHYEEQRLDSPADHLWDLGGNTVLRTLEKYVLALAAAYRPQEVPDKLKRIDTLFRAGIHMSRDKGGAIYEGPSYGWRDTEWMSYIAEVMLRIGHADYWSEEPKFANMFRLWWPNLILPGKQGQNNYSDSARCRAERPPIAMLLAARRLNDPVLWWAWDQLGGRGSMTDLGESPERFQIHLGQMALWEDDDADLARPDEAGRPTSLNSGAYGLMTMRSGWADDDLYFSLLSSHRTPGCFIHQHVDAGHFNLWAQGEAFSVDSGYGDIMGRYHSVMMPGGREPTHACEGFGHMFFGGRPLMFGAGQGADYGCANVGEQWECHDAHRHAMLIKAPGAYPYVVLLDSFNQGPEFMLYRWMLNSEPGNRIEVDNEGERAVVHGRASRLELAWAYPGPEEYPLPHELKLATDRIDSHRWAHPSSGLGMRPRLKAKLYGHNGQLLTAMVPRRADEPALEIERLVKPNQLGFVISLGDLTDTVVASPHSRIINMGGLYGEARIAVARRDSGGKLIWWAAADGNLLEVDGETVLPRRGVAEPITDATV